LKNCGGSINPDKDLVEKEVVAGKKFAIGLNCVAGTTYAWYFRTKSSDIGFQATFISDSNKAANKTDAGEFVVNYSRVRNDVIAFTFMVVAMTMNDE
jgi:hypothetical protein